MPAAQGSGERGGRGRAPGPESALEASLRWGGVLARAGVARPLCSCVLLPRAGPLRGRAPACSCRLRAPPLPHRLRPRARGGRGFRSSHPPKACARGGARHAHLAAPEPRHLRDASQGFHLRLRPQTDAGPWRSLEIVRRTVDPEGPYFPRRCQAGAERMGEDLYIFPKEAKDPSIASPNLSLQNGLTAQPLQESPFESWPVQRRYIEGLCKRNHGRRSSAHAGVNAHQSACLLLPAEHSKSLWHIYLLGH